MNFVYSRLQVCAVLVQGVFKDGTILAPAPAYLDSSHQ